MGKKILILFFIFITSLFHTVLAEDSLKITSINFDNSDNIIFLTASNSVQYINVKSMKLTDPDRICFDIDNAIITQANKSWTFKNSSIKQVKLSQFSTNPNIVRLVINYDRGFNPNKLKLYRIGNNLAFVYNKEFFTQSYFSTVYSDKKSKSNYYEYTSFEEDLKKAAVNSQNLLSPEIASIQQAFNSQGQLAKKDYSQISLKNEKDIKLKSKFYVNRIDVKKGNALIRGVGEIAIEAPFVIQEPSRFVFDLPNTYVAPEIRNKEYVLSENETIKIGQNDPTTARIVVTSPDVEKYRPIFSFDRQSIFLGHDGRLFGLKLYDKTSAIYTYSAKKINDTTDMLVLVFTDSVIYSLNKMDDRVELNLYNSSGFDHDAFKQSLTSDVLAKLRTEALSPSGIKIIIPIKKTTDVDLKESFDNKQLKLILHNPQESIITQGKTVILRRNPNSKTIVIDAGHGGTDVGATREGIYEKDLTLDMAQRLEALLKKKGFAVLMVRDKDEYVSLQDRVDYSENHNADLFISIHVNSSVTPDGNGLETHYYTPQSYEFAQVVHKEFTSAINARDRGLFKSKFYVINHTTCPSILIETGFISNPDERKELMTTQRRQKTAEAIAKGIMKYLGKN